VVVDKSEWRSQSDLIIREYRGSCHKGSIMNGNDKREGVVRTRIFVRHESYGHVTQMWGWKGRRGEGEKETVGGKNQKNRQAVGGKVWKGRLWSQGYRPTKRGGKKKKKKKENEKKKKKKKGRKSPTRTPQTTRRASKKGRR